ncbi:MAG TPA: tetratricopeptide repeat protein [Rudaea sp.]
MRATSTIPKSDAARILSTASWIAKKRGDAAGARRLSDESFALASKPPADETMLFAAYQQRGTAAKMAHDYPAAVDNYGKALALSLKLYGRDDQDTMASEQLLGTALFNQTRFAEAAQHLQAALSASTKVFGETNARTLRIAEMIALNDTEAGHIDEAQRRLEAMLATIRNASPLDDDLLAEVQLNYAELLTARGRLDEAESLLHQVQTAVGKHAGSAPDEEAEISDALGYVFVLRADVAGAESQLRSSLATLQAAHVDDVALVQAHLAELSLARNAYEDALRDADSACDNARSSNKAESLSGAYAHYVRASALHALLRDTEAEAELRTALRIYAHIVPPDGLHPFSADARFLLGTLLSARDDSKDEAARLFREAVDLRTVQLGPAHPKTLLAQTALRTAGNRGRQ